MNKTDKGLFTFTKEMYGLPDSVILGENGKPQEHVLRQALNLTRNQGVGMKKDLAKKVPKGVRRKLKTQFVTPRLTLINRNCAPDFRRAIKPVTAKKLLEEQAEKLKGNTIKYPRNKSFFMGDWGLITLHRYAPDVWEKTLPKEDIEKTADDPDPDLSRMTAQTDLIVSEVAKRAASELENWKKLPEIKKSQMAEVYFALGSYLDMDILNEAVASEPELLNYYSLITSNDYNQALNASRSSETTSEDLTNVEIVPKDPEGYYAAIEQLLLQAKDAPRDASIAPELLLLAEAVSDWFENNPQGAPLSDCMEMFICTLYSLGHDTGAGDFSPKEVTSPFMSFWYRYFSSSDAGVADEDSLLKHLTTCEETINRLSGNLKALTDERQELRERAAKLAEQEPTARSARRQLEDEVDTIQIQLQERKNRRREVVDEILLSVLPPGINLDEYDDVELIETPQEEMVPANMRVALNRVYSYMKGGFVPTKVAIDDREESNLTEEPDLEAEDVEDDWEGLDDELDDLLPPLSEIEVIESKLPEEPIPQQIAADKLDDENVTEIEELDTQESKATEPESSHELEHEAEAIGKIHTTCLDQLNDQGRIDSELINQALITLLAKNRLEIAINLAKLVEEREFAQGTLPSELLSCAYYGRHNWAFGGTLTQSRKMLATITPSLIDEWCDFRDAGKSVPFLIFASCFKPTMFGGNYSNAPSLLASIKQFFTGPTVRLIEDTVALANQNKLVSLNNLRSGGEQANHKPVDFKYLVESLAQRLRNTKRGYAPILKAQSYCVERGVFGDVIEIIRKDKLDALDFVKQFVTTFRDREATDELLDELLVATGQDTPIGAILVQGRSRFFYKVSELVDIAQAWIGKASEKSSEAEEYCRNFSTLLPQVIKSFRAISEDDSQPIDRRAGARLVVACLEDLRKVIDGNEAPVWEHDRVRIWVHYPQNIVRLQGTGKDPFEQLNWYLSQVDKPLGYSDALSLAVEKNDFSLGYLMYLFLRDTGDERKRVAEELDERIVKSRSKLRRTVVRLENQIDSAVLSLLIKPDRGESLIGELEAIQEALGTLRRYSPTSKILEQLDNIRKEIARETASKLRELEESYRSELEQIQASISEPVPDEWIQTMESAIADANLPVVDEMLDEIQTARREGQPIRFSPIQETRVLQDFLIHENEIFSGLTNKDDHKIIWSEIIDSKESCYGLDFSNNNVFLKKVIEGFCSWNNRQTKSVLDAPLYDKVVSVLGLVGLEIVDKAFRRNQKATYDYRLGDGFISLYIKVKSSETRRPFPIFGEAGIISQPIIIAVKEWSSEKLEAYIQSIGMMGSKPIFISGVPLSNIQRNQFSSYFKSSKSPLLHIDLVMALFLATLDKNAADNSAIRNFLWLTLPWSYFNPYVGGGTTFPPPNEMRYGRATEINRLLEMNNGHAIVFGGRQLGKSTIVQEVRRNFSKPKQKQYAYYHLLDKNMDRMGISREDWNNARKVVWQHIHGDLEKAGIVKKITEKTDAEHLSQEVESALLANPDYKIIVIFDEIDPILNVDNAHDFGIFRGIRELVSKPGIQGRFKLIIAGLENVKRFENSPNYPLQQLGGSLQVSIMSTQDALHLIREPLFAAGYTFENAQVANRILSITNRHPGIIQVFCHELISSLANSKRASVGAQIITDEDITNVQQKQEVTDLIRSRFDMTLNLDRRYLIIIYGLLSERKATRAFSAKEAHEIASSWLPDEFEKLGVKQFEAFLTELCGLGVLKAIKEGSSNQYVLRNTNILKLIGDDEDDINDKLLMAIKQHMQSSPLDRHAFWATDVPACPITFRDEKELLGAEVTFNEDSLVKEVGSWKYTTTIIVGSEALGISELESTLPRLYESEQLSHPDLKAAPDYKLFDRFDTDFDSPEKFENIVNGLLTTRSNEHPMMLVVRVMGNKPIAHFLGLLDAAHGLNGIKMDKKYPVRVVFSISPRAYWQWLTHPQLTDGREQLQPFVNLGPWNSSAIAHFLNKLGMGNTPSDIDKITKLSEGWYLSLDILRKIKAYDKNVSGVPHIPSKYVPMMEINPKQSKQFLQASGIKDVSWAESLISAVVDDWGSNGASFDEIQLTSMECEDFQKEDVDIKAAISWLAAMNIVRRSIKSNNSREAYYRISPSILHAMDAENAG